MNLKKSIILLVMLLVFCFPFNIVSASTLDDNILNDKIENITFDQGKAIVMGNLNEDFTVDMLLSYINLDLPSGTQWATGYLTKANGEIELLRFINARNYNIPTIKQFQELLDNTEQLKINIKGQLVTEFVSTCNHARFWLPNGCYNYNGFHKEDNYMFWLKESFNSVKGIFAFGPTIHDLEQNTLYYRPVLLVSKCDTSNED